MGGGEGGFQCFRLLPSIISVEMGDNIIYFVVDFKSDKIIKSVSRAKEWYEWTDRGSNLIRRTTFSRKTMVWLCETMKEASKIKGNHVKKMKIS